jgi:hypothetical protein
MKIMAVLVFVASVLAGTENRTEAAVVVVRPPLNAVVPGAVVIKPISPVARPPFIVRPPFAVRPLFNPFFLRLPVQTFNPSPPFLNLNLLFNNADFIHGVGAEG